MKESKDLEGSRSLMNYQRICCTRIYLFLGSLFKSLCDFLQCHMRNFLEF
uniref:Uncharacterized protein n=1 Tax=Meloidogyne enterolobii TaxID=390850 RepID=A0A6V7WIW7_MELEN|nr:unnamed protein product [Meloidogyne enterolobii]